MQRGAPCQTIQPRRGGEEGCINYQNAEIFWGGKGAREADFPRNIASLSTSVSSNATTWTSQLVKEISTNWSQQFALGPLTIFVEILVSVGKFVQCNSWGDGSCVALVT